MYLVVPPGGAFREPRRIELGPRPLTIGRGSACDVRLDVPGVDDEHAKVSEVALVAVGPDCAVGDVPLDPGARRLLMPGDELQIGSVVLALEGEDPSLLPPSSSDAQEVPAIGHAPPPMAPRLRVVEGPNFGDELVMAEEGKAYTVGRGPKCDLVLEDREVSREHVVVQRQGFKIFVKDSSSTRGSWIGRAAVYQGSSIEWRRPSMLKLGATVLSLDLPEAYRRANAPAQASAGMTPAPRHYGRPKVDSTPTLPDSTAALRSAPPPGAAPARSSADSSQEILPLPISAPELPAAVDRPVPPPKRDVAKDRKAWKKSGATLGRAGGIALLAVATVAIAFAIFVLFSLIE